MASFSFQWCFVELLPSYAATLVCLGQQIYMFPASTRPAKNREEKKKARERLNWKQVPIVFSSDQSRRFFVCLFVPRLDNEDVFFFHCLTEGGGGGGVGGYSCCQGKETDSRQRVGPALFAPVRDCQEQEYINNCSCCIFQCSWCKSFCFKIWHLFNAPATDNNNNNIFF